MKRNTKSRELRAILNGNEKPIAVINSKENVARGRCSEYDKILEPVPLREKIAASLVSAERPDLA